MNNNPLVSVIMSAYNSENYIAKSIESITEQSYKNIEFLIIDDNSQDNTSEVIKDYEKFDKRIKFISNQKNIGLTKSLNKAIKLSQGKLVARQDDDDISLPNRLEIQVKYICTGSYDVCFTRATNMQNSKPLPRYSFYLPPRLVVKYKNPFIHGSMVIKKEILNMMGNYNEKYFYSQDYYLFKRLIQNNAKIKHIKEQLYMLNTKNNISSNFQKEQNYYAQCIQKNIEPDKDRK
jgi:glycosyltransferase involved in cell wall biosynthesis